MRNKLTQDAPTLFIDQYGGRVVASSVQELREKCYGGKVSKMYCDKNDGRTVHVGYVVGSRWFKAYKAVEIPAND